MGAESGRASCEGLPREQTGQDAQVRELRSDVTAMKAALESLQGQESYIVQGRSRKHHRIGVPEAANVPAHWATVCGWRYGLSHFYRSSSIGATDLRCQRCFPELGEGSDGSDRQSGSGSDKSSRSGASSSSDSESESS